MTSKRFRYKLIGRLVLLVITIFIFANLTYSDSSGFAQILILLLIFVQGYYLFLLLEEPIREAKNLMESVRGEDSPQNQKKEDESEANESNDDLNQIVEKFHEIQEEKEAQHQYLKTIVQHIGIGIITFEKSGEVQIINSAAKNLLGIKQLENIKQLKMVSELLVTTIRELRTGGRDLVKISKNNDEEIQVAIHAIELSLRDKEFKLISLQNIQTELDEKEMEAWQNLIRVLTHEIMNSVTPISSLARTIEAEVEDWMSDENNLNTITNDQLEDFHTALHTIHRRSESLIRFVSDFRNMTRITHPKLEPIVIKDLIDHVLTLLKNEIQDAQIHIKSEIPENIIISIDEQQIEQVLINIVKNAVQALAGDEEKTEDKILEIHASSREEGGATVSIKDNGPGIDEEALKKIFIPFFTTKKNGSGIGLSLSKQIMRNHQGAISVRSVLDEGTEFTLKFTQ